MTTNITSTMLQAATELFLGDDASNVSSPTSILWPYQLATATIADTTMATEPKGTNICDADFLGHGCVLDSRGSRNARERFCPRYDVGLQADDV
jgi:hypothetical protein